MLRRFSASDRMQPESGRLHIEVKGRIWSVQTRDVLRAERSSDRLPLRLREILPDREFSGREAWADRFSVPVLQRKHIRYSSAILISPQTVPEGTRTSW